MSEKWQMPAPPENMEWVVGVRPGRTMPSEVVVTLRSKRWPYRVQVQRKSQCGSFFNRAEDEAFFKSVVQGLAADCLDPPEKPELQTQWLREMT